MYAPPWYRLVLTAGYRRGEEIGQRSAGLLDRKEQSKSATATDQPGGKPKKPDTSLYIPRRALLSKSISFWTLV